MAQNALIPFSSGVHVSFATDLTLFPLAAFAANDEMIHGAIDAMSAAGINLASQVTVGYDAIPDAFQYMKDGKLSATIDCFPDKQAGEALQSLVGYIKNKTKPPKEIILIDPELVTKTP